MKPELQLESADPRSPDAVTLIAALSDELSWQYDFMDDGSGLFKPQDEFGPGRAFVIGRVDGKPVACGALRPLDPIVCEIKRMFVLPEYRGRGYSRLILAELERLAIAAGFSAARLETGNRQLAAIHLYESAGYKHIENFEPYIGSVRSVCFERQLICTI